MPEPKEAVKIVLGDDWNASNTSLADDPDIHTGKYDQSSNNPQVTLTNVDENVQEGGDTGVSAITGRGGFVQDNVGTVQVDAWSDRAASDVNPKKLTREFAEEARRVLLETGTDIAQKLQGTKLDGTDLEWLLPQTPPDERPPEVDKSPTVYGYTLKAAYYYKASTD
jgi:hypothetical protein